MKSSYSSISFRRFIFFVTFLFLLAFAVGYLSPPVQAQDFEVTTLSDDVPGSLRAAIASADSYDDIIRFNVTGTIKLNSQLEISGDKGMKIQGPGADLLSVSGGGICRVFYIGDTAESVDISGISIVSGDVGSDGGGIYNLSDNLTVDKCHFSGNHAYSGGGMYNHSSSPEVSNCTFTGNSATGDGGGMYNLYRNPIVTNCTFSSNSAYSGGGMYNNSSSSEVTNCTFYLNSASEGGGMFNDFEPKVTNCTFTGNSAEFGGGMYNLPSADPEVTNCIFWGDGGGEINGGLWKFSYCVISDDLTYYGEHNINIDPLLQPLADNGGPTWTCALGEGSSAIDAGNTIAEVSTDQRGAPRPFNVSFDIGAYESGLEVYEITATSSDGGSISPDKARTLAGIEDEVFYLMPAEGYEIEAVYVDKGVVSYDEASNTYTFENVSDNHEISADFRLSAADDDDDDEDNKVVDDQTVTRDSDGCNISALPGIALLLVLPIMFLFGKMK